MISSTERGNPADPESESANPNNTTGRAASKGMKKIPQACKSYFPKTLVKTAQPSCERNTIHTPIWCVMTRHIPIQYHELSCRPSQTPSPNAGAARK